MELIIGILLGIIFSILFYFFNLHQKPIITPGLWYKHKEKNLECIVTSVTDNIVTYEDEFDYEYKMNIYEFDKVFAYLGDE